ncbi:MAG TPA: alpha/beta fold hydrolase [Caulobacteraceae bacterium]|nr:alpha/beta fold hydrolase [Caulobacteraceae bacterium]
MFTRRTVVAAATAAPLAAPAIGHAEAAAAAPKPPSVDELLKDPVVIDADLSPDGEQVAVLRVFPKDGKTFAFVRLLKAGDASAPAKDVPIGFFDAYLVQWASNERLLLWVNITKDGQGHPTGLMVDDEFYPIPVRRLISMDLNGADQVILFGQKKNMLRQAFDLATVADLMPDDPQHILMQVWDEDDGAYGLYQVDVVTGGATKVERGSSQTDSWATQGGRAVLRFDSNERGTVFTVYARAPGETSWKFYRKFRRNELKKLPEFDSVAATAEPGVMLVAMRPENADRVAIRRFDLKSLEFGDIVAQTADHDMEGAFIDMKENLVGCAFVEDRRNYAFSDAEFARHFRALNTYFGNECNVTLYDASLDHSRFIVSVSGPRQPGAFFLYNRKSVQVVLLGEKQPWLSQDRLGRMETLKVTTRDGAAITAYLTLPIGAAGGTRPPMVVMPHGGPEIRDQFDFDIWAQAFAAQGWAVLQPNFRGSGGYGKAFADAGRKHWGDRMQEDVEDAVAAAVAAGKVDARRVAICGASYGGYSALMEAVRRPDLYKAVVSVAGDCSLVDTLAFSRHEDGSDSPTYAYWLASIGDPKADEAALKAASPALRAAEIRAPVLLIHGTRDKIVDPKQSKIMAKALKEAGKPYEYVELKGEGHRDWSNDTWKTVLERSAGFIARYI